MLIGRWSSNAFLVYIRKQVQDFTKEISSKMLISPNFFTISDTAAHIKDPRTRGDMNNFAARQNGGNLERRITAPRFALHN
eukprot:8039524-Ditylum_brightwellii.AAC.1